MALIFLKFGEFIRKLFKIFYVSRRGTVCFPFGNPTFLRRETYGLRSENVENEQGK
jgi:hypothetical protein